MAIFTKNVHMAHITPKVKVTEKIDFVFPPEWRPPAPAGGNAARIRKLGGFLITLGTGFKFRGPFVKKLERFYDRRPRAR